MSWDVRLVNGDGKVVQVTPHTEGTIIVVGGYDLAEMGVTYNYSDVLRLVAPADGDLKDLLDMRLAGETTAELQSWITALHKTTPYKDYWAATPGNVGHMLSILLGWARMYPLARWEVR